MSPPQKQITVIGAGVIGLTTAIKLQEKGYEVTIVAEIWPTDSERPSANYTSHWAGGHHCTAAESEDRRQQKMDTETFKVFWEMSEPGHPAEKCFIRTPQHEHYFEDLGHPRGLETMPDFKLMPKSALILDAVFGISFTAISFDPPMYLKYLYERFLTAGGKLVHGSVQHIKQVVEGGSAIFEGKPPAPPAAVLVCPGLGARTLGGVEDKTVTSVRGQTVVLHAPWVKFGATRRKIENEFISYVIPRHNGNIVLGGTLNVDDWYPLPREETKIAIMEKALALWPEIAPPEARKDRVPTIEDLYPILVEEGLGLRPHREDGIRIESQWVETNGVKAPVVFHYGHGAYGFESSWGSASMAVDLMEEVLKTA
ncbi:D-aspartate oxidase [Mycena metata]|uniref:D-aspartate oxidase n=1 Tax=Mycena metata TaxID=1033252 RepID=A0AAD7N7J1_9AGAR|nr:D-aspartate oxidase [Mycena metata]KAJ7747782.1 D-aspartate oxidase [Mycena metata]